MNDFRSRVLPGQEPPTSPLRKKAPRQPAKPREDLESLDGLTIRREASRTANHRLDDRHRLPDDAPVSARHKGRQHEVQLINLSGGGAMIEAAFRPQMWDRVDLHLAGDEPSGRVECAVRWIRGERIGLEFAHETHIDADEESRAALLKDVLERSFSDVVLEAGLQPADETSDDAGATSPRPEPERETRRGDPRHPLIWSGHVLFSHDSHPVRLRNISASGALIESATGFPVGEEVYLDLGAAGSFFALVSWAHGDQCGLAFREPFDIARLAAAKPQLAPGRWSKPDYLRDESLESSPWASEWGRLSLDELHKTLRR